MKKNVDFSFFCFLSLILAVDEEQDAVNYIKKNRKLMQYKLNLSVYNFAFIKQLKAKFTEKV